MNKYKTGKEGENFANESHRDFWLPLITDYLDGTLVSHDKEELEQHLPECAICRADLQGLREAQGLLRRLPEIPAPRSFVLTPAQARRLKPSPLYRYSQVAAAIAAAFLLFAFVLDLAGVFAPVPVAPVVTVAKLEPTVTLPPVGDINGTDETSNKGSVSGFAVKVTPGSTATPNPTAVPAVSSAPVQAATDNTSTIRVAEFALLALTILFASFAIALRPRAPGRLKL